MARIAFALPAPIARANMHWIGGVGLGMTVLMVLGSIAIFGSGDSSRPKVSLSIPSLAETTQVKTGLRSDHAGVETDTGHGNANSYSGTGAQPDLPMGNSAYAGSNNSNPAHSQQRSNEQPQIPASAHALSRVPASGMTARGPGGLLPVLGPNGERASDVYARPFVLQEKKPAISVVMGGLGLMERTTLAAIEELPPEVTLSFVPYTPDLQNWIDRARAAGHEVILELPMEPFGYPETDPGPYTLLSTASSAENTRRLEWLLSRASGYFAVSNYMGSKLTASETALPSIMRGLNQRGVDFLYDGETRRSALRSVADREGLRWATADRIVDAKRTSSAIDDQLLRLEALAIQNGSAIGMGISWPITIKQLKDWTHTLEAKGYQLAPVSAIIRVRNEKKMLKSDVASATADSPEHH